MRIFKLILFIISIVFYFQNYSYSFEIIKSKNESEYNVFYNKYFKDKEVKNSSYVDDYYLKDKGKNGIFLIKDINLSIKLKNLYIADYDSPSGPFEIKKVEHNVCELDILYDNDRISKLWQSPFSCNGVVLVDFLSLKLNSKSYNIALIDTVNTYIYPRPVCAPIDNCQNDQPVHEPEVKIVLIYDPATDNWIDSKYLADQRINYLASVNGKTSLKKFAGILKKQIKDLNIDLEDISPAAQTCYFLEPLEPCYKNLK